jgi:peptide/nickel transport system substrate-binding protein
MKIDLRPSLGIVAIVLLALTIACGPAAPTAAPAKPPVAVTSVAPTSGTSAPAAIATKPAAAAPTAAPVSKIKRGGVLKYANATEPSPTLDPHTHMAAGRTFDLMYGNFTKYVEDTQTKKWSVQPWYAEAWEQPDTKTLIFKLKKGVRFQDGTVFNADVAKWNLDRMLTHKTSTVRQDIGVLDKVDIVDEYTIKLSLKAPPGGLLAVLSDSAPRGYIVSKDYWEKTGDAAGRKPIGSGPMQFVEWKDGDHITFKKWDNYWEMGEDGKPLPYLDGVEYRIVPDATAKLLSLRSGAFDAVDNLPLKDVVTLQKDPNYQVHFFSGRTNCNYYFFNTTRSPWKGNIKLRQALLYAVDGQSIANVLGFGMGRPVYYHWGPSDIGYDTTLPKYDFQPEKAKQLMAEAGYAGGLEIELMHWPTWPHAQVAEILVSMWDKIGVRAKMLPTERTATEKAWMAANYDLGHSGKQIGELDPSVLEYRFRSGEIKNYAHYGDPNLDKCFDEGRMAPDDKTRAEIYKKCQKIIYENATFGLPWEYDINEVFGKHVKGWTSTWRLEPNWARVWMDK